MSLNRGARAGRGATPADPPLRKKGLLFRTAPLDPMRAGRPRGVGAFCAARIISIAGPSSRKERPVEHPTFYRTTQIDGLSIFYREAGPKRCADASPAARTSLFIADVRASLRPAFRSVSPCRARLPGLRTQRVAGPEKICVYVRSLRRGHESLHRCPQGSPSGRRPSRLAPTGSLSDRPGPGALGARSAGGWPDQLPQKMLARRFVCPV
jgi:hypothetical protein